MDLKEYLNNKRRKVEQALEDLLKPQGLLTDHCNAMRYSLLAGGKRIRPILCLAAVEALHGDSDKTVYVACAIECIHTYSLIHDDLPAMDDDDLRRGMPTNHKKFGEAEAILAGDGLLTFAFDLLSDPGRAPAIPEADRLRLIHIIAGAAGPYGMVGGQCLDVASEGKEISFDTLRFIHSRKTGALITASIQAGAIVGGATEVQYESLTRYGENIGLAFQIVDDLLNVEGTAEQLGKAVGSDAERNKATYPAFFGVDGSKEKVKKTINDALSALDAFDHQADPLRELAHYILTRKK